MERGQDRPAAAVAVAVLVMAAASALLLALPGQTVVTAYVNDLFIFLDGAHRVVSGQVPNRDFHTALGPLAFYIPAAGYLLSGNLGGAMPVGTTLFILALAPAMAHVLGSRLRPAIAIPFAAFLVVIAAVPMNLGEAVTALSFGMFYNRIGWVVLALILVMYLRPEKASRRQHWLDALCAAFLVLVLLYMKISYGLVAVAFLVFMLLDSRQRGWAAAALVITVIAALAVETVWRASAAHVEDLLLTSRVSGGLRRIEDLVSTFLRHLADYTLFAILVVPALWRTRSLRDLLFYGYCAATGLLIINQNSQPWGIITLHAGAVVAAETLLRGETSPEWRGWSLAPAAPLLVVALVLPTIVHGLIALGLHTALATAPNLATTRSGRDFGLPELERLRLARLWSPGDYDFAAQYLASLQDGVRALSSLDLKPSHVFVLDFVSPFSAALGLIPPRGDTSWQHWGRNVNEVHFIPPEQLFRDVRMVMEPKWGINVVPLRHVYGKYIAENFDLVRETEGWRVHVSRHWLPDGSIRSVEATTGK